MATIENVSGTAFVVAEFRAEENREPAPLYRDLVVGLFLSDDSRHAASRVASSFAPVKDMVKIRTRYFDDVLERHLLEGFRQVVILGAGLDTRAVRKRTRGVRYFEIDDPATLELKQRRYRQEGVETDVAFIPGNYVTDGLLEMLERHGFDVGLPTYFIWEGNTMYLPLDSDKYILTQLRTRVRRFRISFDYLTESVIAKTTGDRGMTSLVESFANMGAPWLTGIRDIRAFASELKLSLIEDFRTSDLYQMYWLGRPMMSPIFFFYSVCTLGA
jgi:methyltransferase (TIGR00027 family)